MVGELFEILPLDAEGEGDLEDAIDSVATPFSVIGLIGILGLLWSASGMMGALRQALNQAWDLDYRRPFLRGKSVDLIMVLSMGFLLALSIGSTIFLQVARRVSDDLSDLLGPVGAGATLSFEVVAVLVPLTFSFAHLHVHLQVRAQRQDPLCLHLARRAPVGGALRDRQE